jgi:hypothetical protein
MIRYAVCCLVAALASFSADTACAQCPSLPFTLTNGQVADATQVMADFDALATCLGANGTVAPGNAADLAKYGATTTVSGQSLSAYLDSIFGGLQGGILYRAATGWTALAPGPTGYVLQTSGPSADPSWAPANGGGGGIIGAIVAAGTSSGASTVALPLVPLISRPALGALTWLNQSSATATDNANGPLALRTTQVAGTNINGLIKSIAGASWTVTMHYALGNHTGAPSTGTAGLIVYNSANGRLYRLGLNTASGGAINLEAFNSVTSFNSTPGSKVILLTPDSVWSRAQFVSGTNTLTFSYSIDGFTWETVYSVAASAFLGVPTAYGIAVEAGNNVSGLVLSLNYMVDSTP